MVTERLLAELEQKAFWWPFMKRGNAVALVRQAFTLRIARFSTTARHSLTTELIVA